MTTNSKKLVSTTLYEHQNIILQICNEFLKKHQLAFFAYLCCFKDSRCYILSTHPDVYQFLLDAEMPLTAPIEQEMLNNRKIYYMVPDSRIYGDVMHNISLRFNLFYPLDLIIRSNDCYEMFCYGINKEDFNKVSYYMNNLLEFEQFSRFFKEKAQKIIKNLNNNHIILPESMFNPVKHLILPDIQKGQIHKASHAKDNKYPITVNGEIIILTKREYDCLICLLEGKTAQETAEKLFISRRTVETYLDILKQKTFSRNKIDLTAKVKNLFSDI